MAVHDDFPFPGSPEGPYIDGFPITPNDSADLEQMTNAIHVGTAGNIRVLTQRGRDAIFAVTAGWHRIRVSKVFSTNTTAAGISGWV